MVSAPRRAANTSAGRSAKKIVGPRFALGRPLRPPRKATMRTIFSYSKERGSSFFIIRYAANNDTYPNVWNFSVESVSPGRPPHQSATGTFNVPANRAALIVTYARAWQRAILFLCSDLHPTAASGITLCCKSASVYCRPKSTGKNTPWLCEESIINMRSPSVPCPASCA